MNSRTTTTDEATRLLGVLCRTEAAMTAAELAGRLALTGCRESQRRHIRALVKRLRDEGKWIVATLQGGYWLTEDRDLWRDWLEHRSIDAKRLIGESHRRQKMLTDASGQGLLFGPKS